jgi:hypothetical protein
MATYTADNYTHPVIDAPGVGISLIRTFKFTVATALALNDIIKLIPIQGLTEMELDEWFIDSADLDTGGSPAILLQLGDTDTAARYMAANNVGQAGGKVFSQSNGVAGALPAKYAAGAEKDIRLTVSTGPATGATAVVIRGWAKYHLTGIASVF